MLRQVVAERRKEYVVDRVRRSAGARRGACTGPGIPANVGILRAELKSALGTVVGFDPEPERAFDYALGLATATPKPTKVVTAGAARRRQGFCVATAVSIGWRSIAHHLTGAEGVSLIAASRIVFAAIEVHIKSGIAEFEWRDAL